MKKVKKKKTPWGQYLMSIIFLLTGVICGMIIAEHGGMFTDEGINLLYLALGFVGMIGALFLQIIIHEGGHLVFGLLTGYGFSSFRVGSLMVVKEEGRLKLKKLSLGGTGGQCLMNPPEEGGKKPPVVLYNLGGCIMNLISAVVFFAFALLIPEKNVFSGFLVNTAVIGIAYCLVNGIPMRLTFIDNDGKNALSALESEKARGAFLLQLKINKAMAQGQRLRDMPEEWFELPEKKDMLNTLVATLAVFAACRLMDEKKYDEARKLTAELYYSEYAIVGVHRNLMRCNLIYLELMGNRNPSRLESLMDKTFKKQMKASKTDITLLRTQFTYELLGEEDGVAAAKTKERFNRVAKNYPYPAEAQGERELIVAAEMRKKEKESISGEIISPAPTTGEELRLKDKAETEDGEIS